MTEAQSDVAVVDWEGQIDSCPNFTKIDQSAKFENDENAIVRMTIPP